MPELPEVQTIATQLARSLAGLSVSSVEVRRRDYVRAGGAALEATLAGRRLEAFEREGKRIRCPLSGGGTLVFHLGMSGRLTVAAPATPEPPHTHVVFRFAERGLELRFHDPRRFGGLWLLDSGASTPPSNAPAMRGLRSLGHDALSITPRALADLLHRRRQVKALLMDQQAISGLGNIYCDEALFDAGIHPLRRASTLNVEEVGQLARAIRKVLRRAIAAGGSSLRDYRNADGEPGYFQISHRVYGRDGQSCRRCGTTIRRIQAAGRSTHFCPTCQPRKRRRQRLPKSLMFSRKPKARGE